MSESVTRIARHTQDDALTGVNSQTAACAEAPDTRGSDTGNGIPARSLPPLYEPSMIVCTQSLMPAPVHAAATPSSRPIAPHGARTSSSRACVEETIRMAVMVSPRPTSPLWMVGAGFLLVGLITCAWLGVSLASSSASYASTGGPPLAAPASSRLAKVASPSAAVMRVPEIQALEEPTSTSVAPEVVVPLPGVSLSGFHVVWGRTSGPQLRAAVRHSISKMKRCFEQMSRDALTFPDKLALTLRLRENGVVMWVGGVGSKRDSSSTQDCIKVAFHTTQFPRSRAGLRLNTELVFTPRHESRLRNDRAKLLGFQQL